MYLMSLNCTLKMVKKVKMVNFMLSILQIYKICVLIYFFFFKEIHVLLFIYL